MRRDTIFYQLFTQFPALLFELVPNPPPNFADYIFNSVEVKETSFRIDGVFLPPDSNGIIYFCEVQFQKDDLLYERLNSEIAIYSYRNRNKFYDWRAVVIYPSRSVEQEKLATVSEIISSERITRIYLDELSIIGQLPIGLELMLLTTLADEQAVTKAKILIQQSQQRPDSRVIIDIVSTIMVYRFTNLTRTEVETMIGITLQETRVYQDAKAEGRQAEGQSLVIRQLSRQFGDLSPEANAAILDLTLEQLEDLSEALLDFQELTDLMSWLQTRANQ
jgi:predicted transposase/invertase (TIGR01784 family)